MPLWGDLLCAKPETKRCPQDSGMARDRDEQRYGKQFYRQA